MFLCSLSRVKWLFLALLTVSIATSAKDEFGEALAKGAKALDMGACKDAATSLRSAVGLTDDFSKQIQAALMAGDAFVCMGEYGNAETIANQVGDQTAQ